MKSAIHKLKILWFWIVPVIVDGPQLCPGQRSAMYWTAFFSSFALKVVLDSALSGSYIIIIIILFYFLNEEASDRLKKN